MWPNAKEQLLWTGGDNVITKLYRMPIKTTFTNLDLHQSKETTILYATDLKTQTPPPFIRITMGRAASWKILEKLKSYR